MKIKAAKDGVMVRLVVNGMPLFVTNQPVDVDDNNLEVMEQVNVMMKLGWLIEVKEDKVQMKTKEANKKNGEGAQEESK
jgi:hypothetical protein